MSILVVGSANTDYTIKGPNLPKPGETTIGQQFLIGQGGKGANQAVAVARLGVPVSFVGCVGHDERGNDLIQHLQNEGVDTKDMIADSQMPTGAAVIQVENSGEKQIFIAPNAGLRVRDVLHTDSFKQALLVIMQLEIPLDTVIEVAQVAYLAHKLVILDPAPSKDLPDELLRCLTLIKPNQSEAEYLTGVSVWDRDSARKAAKVLLNRGVQAVSVQVAEEGDLLVTRSEEYWLPRFSVDSVDATGAGDAFTAAMAVALLEGNQWEEAGQFASAAAALTTTKLGAQDALPTREAVQDLLKQRV